MTLAQEMIGALLAARYPGEWPDDPVFRKVQPSGNSFAAVCRKDARAEIIALFRTLRDRGPSERMIAASAADPAMRSVESAIKIAAIHGVELRWPDDGQKLSPIQRSFRAMLAELIREIEEER